MPKVSVIIPNYNHAQFLEKRIQSILNQTYQDFEIIYLDDASTDNSNQVFAKFAGEQRIQTIYNDSNSGSPFKQWNKGIRLAKGDYIWIAESDDYADKQLLAELVNKLDNNPTVGVAYCQSWIVDECDNTIYTCKEWIGSSDKKRWEKDFINIGKSECGRYLIFDNTIPNASAVLIRRSIYEEVGYADETMKLCGDWMLWVKILLISDIAFVAEPLNYYRVHSGTVRHKTYKNGIYAEESYQVVRYILGKLSLAKEVIEQVCEAMIDRWLYIVFSESGEIPCHRNYRIYKIASDVDAKLKPRLFKKTRLKVQSIQTELERSQAWNWQLQKGKDWLESQYHTWKQIAEETQKELERSQSWIQELQKGKDWYESQHQIWIQTAQQAQAELEQSQYNITVIKSGKFRRLQTAWFRLKQVTGLVKEN